MQMQTTTFDTVTLPAAEAPAVERAAFVRKTYAHVAAALGIFALLEAALIQAGLGDRFLALLGTSQYSWLLVLGAFMIVGYVANRWALSNTSSGMQYLGLALYVVVEAIIFLPLLTIAANHQPDAIGQAGVLTMALVAGITAVAFITRKDFSFLGPILGIGGMIAMGVIVAAILFGFTLGTLFSAVMVLFAGGAVLYSTSNILHQYNTTQHVAASLSLFASIALLFWYVLRIVMAFGRD